MIDIAAYIINNKYTAKSLSLCYNALKIDLDIRHKISRLYKGLAKYNILCPTIENHCSGVKVSWVEDFYTLTVWIYPSLDEVKFLFRRIDEEEKTEYCLFEEAFHMIPYWSSYLAEEIPRIKEKLG